MRPQIEHSGILTCARDRQKHDAGTGLDATEGRAAAPVRVQKAVISSGQPFTHSDLTLLSHWAAPPAERYPRHRNRRWSNPARSQAGFACW
jgi:hypothetical protein